MVEKSGAQRLVHRLIGIDTHAGAQQAARAVRRVRAQRAQWQRFEAVVGAHAVERGREVGRGVGERAVEIEQHRVDGERLRRCTRMVESAPLRVHRRLVRHRHSG